MPDNDDYGFWDGDLDWSGQRPRARRRVRQVAPISDRIEIAERVRADRLRTERVATGPNLVVRRLGALGAVGLIAVTAALVVRGTGGDDRISTADAAGAPPTAIAAGVPTAESTAGVVTVATVGDAPLATAPSATAPTAGVDGTSPSSVVVSTPRARAETAAVGRAVVIVPVVETKRTCNVSYKVRSGDYWISIARNSNVKLADLLNANGAKVTTPIYPGRTICLPANATPPTTAKPATTTTVKPTPTTKPTATTAKPTPTTVKPTVTTKPKVTVSTTPPSTTAPSTTAAPPQNNYSRAEVEQIIRNVWPDDLEDEAVRIATRESNLIPTVRNSCCYGLFQIYFGANKASLTSWGITSPNALYDPQTNAYAAYAMYLRAGGWGPWGM